MKISLLLVTCFIAVTGVCFAQNVVMQDSVQTTGENLETMKKPIIPSGRTILADMKTNNPAMYSQYRSGIKMQKTGIIMIVAGGAIIYFDFAYFLISDMYQPHISTAVSTLFVAGAVVLSVGLSVMIVGGKKKRQTFQDFKNQYYLSPQTSSYFQLNIYPNRVGIAYVF